MSLHNVTPGPNAPAEFNVIIEIPMNADPIKYDFSVCHLGMMNACGFETPRGNTHCPLKGVCSPRRAVERRKATR